MDLTVHIGLHKTGTTAFQNQLFPLFPGYIGAPARGTEPNREVLSVASWNELYGAWFTRSKNLPEQIGKFVERLKKNSQDSYLLSSEGFHAAPQGASITQFPLADGWSSDQFREHPVHNFFDEILTGAPDIRLRTIVTFRNQPEYLASHYVQAAHTFRRPGQKDFDSKLERVISDQDQFLNWFKLATDLEAQLGPDNCLFMFFEDGLEHNSHRVSDFLDFKFPQSSTRFRHENVKRIGSSSWVIPPRARKKRRRPKNPSVLGSFIGPVFGIWWSPKVKKQEIILRESQRELVTRTYSESNRRLAELTERNLGGYY